jgi:hypothetical protein
MSSRILLVLFLLACFSCKQSNTPRELYGRWILDSTSGRGGKIISGGPRGHTEFTLGPDNTVNYKWSDFDVSDENNGKYFYDNTTKIDSPKLIFSFYSNDKKDSVVSKDSIIVLNLSDSLLKALEKESYTILDSVLISRNRINVYRKSVLPKKGR